MGEPLRNMSKEDHQRMSAAIQQIISSRANDNQPPRPDRSFVSDVCTCKDCR